MLENVYYVSVLFNTVAYGTISNAAYMFDVYQPPELKVLVQLSYLLWLPSLHLMSLVDRIF